MSCTPLQLSIHYSVIFTGNHKNGLVWSFKLFSFATSW